MITLQELTCHRIDVRVALVATTALIVMSQFVSDVALVSIKMKGAVQHARAAQLGGIKTRQPKARASNVMLEVLLIHSRSLVLRLVRTVTKASTQQIPRLDVLIVVRENTAIQ